MKTFKFHLIIWSVCFVLFNIFAQLAHIDFNPSFRTAYVFIIIAFLFNLGFSLFYSKHKRGEPSYTVAVLLVNHILCILTIAVGCAIMIIPFFVPQLTIMIMSLMLAATAIATIGAYAAAASAYKKDKHIKTSTYTIRMLISDSERLAATARTDLAREYAGKVYSALKYSDPVSTPAVYELNELIQNQFSAFLDAVESDDNELLRDTAEELIVLIDKRNKKCALFK